MMKVGRIASKFAPTRFDVHACKSYRKKWGEWQKCYEQLESLQLEFEMAVEEKPCLKEFADEVSEKVSVMAAFKKVYMKFSLGLEQYLKKDRSTYTPVPHNTHICIHAYACVYIYIYIHICMYIQTAMYAHARVWKYIYIYIFFCFVHVFVYVCMYIMCLMHLATATQCAGAHAWTNVPMHMLVQRV